ncbi:hypothetical protein ES708_03672 [subsurface metagenome]
MADEEEVAGKREVAEEMAEKEAKGERLPDAIGPSKAQKKGVHDV